MDNELLWSTRVLLRELGDELLRLDERKKRFDREIESLARQMPACQRLMAIPGIGMMTGRRRWPRSAMRRSSVTVERWRRGLVWCHGNGRRAVGRRCWASASVATATCGLC